jgi:adhesin transport system outer membrane protein
VVLATPYLVPGAAAQQARPVAEPPVDQSVPVPRSVKLEALLKDLVKTHDRIKAAEAGLQAAQHLVGRAKGAYFPKLDVTVQGGREDITYGMQNTTTRWRNEEDIKLTQLLYDFGGTPGSVALYEGARKEFAAKLDQARQEVLIQGITSYLQVIRARETLKYAIRSEDNIKRLSGMQEALVQRGAAFSYEELQVKGQLAGSQAQRVNVERSLATAKNNFRAVFGYEPSPEDVEAFTVPELPGGAIPKTLEAAIDKALVENPFLVEIGHTIERQTGDQAARRAALFPKFEAIGERQRKEQDQGAFGERVESRATLQMTYNLFSGFSDLENVRSSKAEQISTRKTLLDRRRGVEERVRNAWVDLMTLRKNVELYENQANITWEFLGLVKKKKAMGGEVGLLDILVGERDYISAISAKVAADIDTIIAGYTLLYQMGQVTVDLVGKQN